MDHFFWRRPLRNYTCELLFGYDAKGQVVSDNHDTNNTFDRTYAFDGIGNRTTATEDTTTVNYTANSKNQYSAVGSNSYTYDADGNLTDDGTYKYVYDAENRLIKTTNQSGTTLGLYGYDYLSRRITRFKATTTQTFGYVYDGWNLIAEYYTPNYNFNKAFTWGQDLSGTMQGAGGVGGLLMVKDVAASKFYPLYDGNGNVSEFLNASRTVVAHYEYDAFGNSVVKTGSQADYFGFRFSTKRITPEVNLYYYGYRYYNPETGRWINRDPIEEEGGLNVYGFVGNDGVNAVDKLGELEVDFEYDDPYTALVFDSTKGSKKSKVAAFATFDGYVKCFCRQRCELTCIVDTFSFIFMNVNKHPKGSNNYNAALSHERMHVMSWAYKVKTDIVTPLTKEKCKFNSEEECATEAKKLQKEYSKKLGKLSKAGDHARIDKAATKYSPSDGVYYRDPNVIKRIHNEWLEDMRRSRVSGEDGNAIYGRCKE